MTYPEVMEYMLSQLPMFYRVGQSAYKANLDTALALDNYFDHPHRLYKTIHVAGTNGKGSVSHMLAAILQKAGYKTGLFTSPHLKDFRERIRVNGEMISREDVIDFITNHRALLDELKPSFFEMSSALAFYHFAKAKVDVAVIEVGMGGRLDSTNIITPVLSVITNIGFDHTEFLGDTLAKIAKEKAGIIKHGVPVVVGEYHSDTWAVFQSVSNLLNSKVVLASESYEIRHFADTEKQAFNVYQGGELKYESLKLDLAGYYQQKNLCTVITAFDQLQKLEFSIQKSHLYESLSNVMLNTGLQGRWQTLGHAPLIICDTAHNKEGVTWVVKQLKMQTFKQLHMVIGFVKDKDVTGILKLLPADAQYYFTQANIPRALDAAELKTKAVVFGLRGDSYGSVQEAFAAAKANAFKEDFIFIGGSTFVVAEAI